MNARDCLRMVDACAYHMCPLPSLTRAQIKVAYQAIAQGWLRRMPAQGRWPERLVVTSAGSHVLGTFDVMSDTFHHDVWMCRVRAK